MGFSTVSLCGQVMWKREHRAQRAGNFGVTLGVECGHGTVIVTAWSDSPDGADVVYSMRAANVGSEVVVNGHLRVYSYEDLRGNGARWVTKVYPMTFDVVAPIKAERAPAPPPKAQEVVDDFQSMLEKRLASLERTVRESLR